MNILITGTSRGIGFALTQKALSEGASVIAVARNPSASEDLVKGKYEYKERLKIIQADLTDPRALASIKSKVESLPHLDVLINNAGVYKEDTSIADFQESFLINSTMPFFLTKELSPKLRLAQNPLSLQITSMMGSIQDTGGGSYSYRASKAALNMLFKNLSVDEKWLTSILVHPGWVQTRMGGENAPLTTTESVAGIWKIIQSANKGMSGKYVDHSGKSLNW